MDATKLSILFSVTTNPADLVSASPHSGGWSESFWTTKTPAEYQADLLAVMNARAVMLPRVAAVIGSRAHKYTIDGPILLPIGSSAGGGGGPGSPGYTVNQPQDSLMFKATGSGVINTAPITVKCIPEEWITNGEYQPTFGAGGEINAWTASMKANGSFGFIHRDFSQGAVPVLGYAFTTGFGYLTSNAAIPGVGIGDWIILRKVKDDSGKSLAGSFKVADIVGTVYRLLGAPNQLVTNRNGTVRKDQRVFAAYGEINIARSVVRKIGGPFDGYRGRRSRKRR